MSVVMMEALKVQNASLTRQVEQLGPENERVRKLLTEFAERHSADQAEIERLRSIIKRASGIAGMGRRIEACEILHAEVFPDTQNEPSDD